ncbi:hypothetical protein TGFOU_318210 [Toxoplasma gondii FOU]|uniref:Uncharacterized protein n=1 Tax=Toxoplasma gondii FOU TaxID=943167 RepID=A0A086JVA5_TOXGO|nr:hypothetical protein TGFOU_318210 [Toxoplasma gondii FOU]
MPGRKEDLREESLGRDRDASPEELAHASNLTDVGNNGNVSTSPLSSSSQEEKGEDADEPAPRSPRESSVDLSVSNPRDRPQILMVEPNGRTTASDSPAGPRRGACVGGEDARSAGMATSSRKSPALTPVPRDRACRRSGSLEDAPSGGDGRRQQVERCEARDSMKGVAGDTRASSPETDKESRRAPGASVNPCLSPSGQAKCTDAESRGIHSSDARAGLVRASAAGVVSRVTTNGPQSNGYTSVSYLDDFYMRQRTRAEYEAQRREEARREMTTWRGAPATKEFQWLQRLRHEQDESPASGSPGSAAGPSAGPVYGRALVGALRASTCGQADVWHRGDLSSKSPGKVIKRSATLPEETRLVKHLISLFQAGSTRRPSWRSGGAQSGEVHSSGSPREGTVPGPPVRQWETFRPTSPPTSGSNEGVSSTAGKRSGYFSVRALGRTLSFPRPSASSTRGAPVPGGSFGSTQPWAEAQRAPSRSTDCLGVPAYFSSDASSLVHGPWPAGEHASPRRVSVHSDPRSTSWAVPTHQPPAGIPMSSSSGTPAMSLPVFVTPRPTAASGPPRLSREEVLVIQDALLRYQAVRQQGQPIQGVPHRGEYRRVPAASYSSLFRGAPGVGGTPGPIVHSPNGAVTFNRSQQRQRGVADAGGACRLRQNTRESIAGNKGDVGVSKKLERSGAEGAGVEPFFERVEPPTASSEAIAEDPENLGARDEEGNRGDDARKTEIEREEARALSAGRGTGAREEEGKTYRGDSRPTTGESDVREETQSAVLQHRREERSINADGAAEVSAGASIKDSVAVSQDESAKEKTWSDTEAAPVGEPAATDQSTLGEAIECEASGPATRRRVDARALSVAVSTVSSFAGQQTAAGQEEGPPGAVTSWQTHEEAIMCLADCFAAAAVDLEGSGHGRSGDLALAMPEDPKQRQECEGTSPPDGAVQFGISGVLDASDSSPSDDVPQEDLKPYERIMLKFLQYREWWEAQTKSGGDGESQAVDELLSVFDANGEDGVNDGERKRSLDANEEAQQLREIDAILESIPDLRRDIQLFGTLDSFGASELAADAGLFNFNFAEQDAIHLFSEDEGEDEDSGKGGDEAPTDRRFPNGPKDPREPLAGSLEVPSDVHSGQSALPGVGGAEDTDDVTRVASETPISASALLRAQYLVGPLRVSHLAAGTAAGQRIGDSSSSPDANHDTEQDRQ